MYNIPEREDEVNGLNYLNEKTNRTFLKIIYTLESDTTENSIVDLNYNAPDDKYINFNIGDKGTELQKKDENIGRNFGEFHFNPISALKEDLDENSLNLIDEMVFNIENLVDGTQYIISIKDHFSRLETILENNLLDTRIGYGFKITLRNNEEIITDDLTNQNLESGNVVGEDAIGFPSITYTHSESNTELNLKVENNRKFPYFIVNIAEVKEDTKNYILKFDRGINFALENDTTDLNDEKMNFYINNDIEDLKIIKLVENTGISSSVNNLDQQSLTFQMNFEESNTVDLSPGYTYSQDFSVDTKITSFIGTLNKFINFSNKSTLNEDNRKFPTLKILKLSENNYTDNNYFEDTEEIGNLKKQNPFKEKIYYPFVIPKLYRSSTIRGNFNSKIISESAFIYKSNLYLDYGDDNIIEEKTNFYNNIKFPLEFELPNNKLFNCLVYEFEINPVSKTNITELKVTLNSKEKSKLKFVLQLEAQIPDKGDTTSSSLGSFSDRNINLDQLFDYDDDFYNDNLYENLLDLNKKNNLDDEDDDIFDEEFFNFIKKNVNRSQKIKDEELTWINRNTNSDNKNTYQGINNFLV